MVKDCPKCRMVNPPEAVRCDCGYDFVSRKMEQSYLSAADEKAMLSRDDLRSTALYQKGILCCILAYFLLVGVSFVLPPEVRLLLAVVALLISIAATMFVFLLATKVYSTALGVALGILTLIPFIGLIVLLSINGQANAILKKHGIKVGLLGAKLADLK